MSVMNQSNDLDNSVNETGTNCEGLSLGSCPMEEQRGPGRYPTTPRTGWSKSMNVAVMECYFLSKPVDEEGKPVRGYRRRMHSILNERQTLKVTEQQLCDQARIIRKNGWLTQVELDDIKQRLSTQEEMITEASHVVEEGNIVELTETVLEREPVATILENHGRNEVNSKAIGEIINIMNEGNLNTPVNLKTVDRRALNELVNEIDNVLADIRTDNITDTNKLIHATAVYVAREFGFGERNKAYRMKEPWWKRRIIESISKLRKDINILERKKRGESIKNSKYNEISRKYNVTKKGITLVIEELKQRLQAKAFKLRRYEQRTQQYQIDRMFQYDQANVYQKLQCDNKREISKPSADESKKFWSEIWDNKIQHNNAAKWLEELRNNKRSVVQNDMEITTSMVKQQIKKIPNWRAPGPDGVQGFWLNKLTSLHERIASQLNDLLHNQTEIPAWMTTGKTVLCQKVPRKGNAVDNYRPISCLPVMWKLMTGIISDSVYKCLDENEVLPEEQKGCKRNSRGTKDQLLVDKTILADCKKRHKNLTMAWVDYKKAYDMVPHSWILECMRLYGVSDSVTNFLKRSMSKWMVQLTSCGEILGTVNIRRGIFQGDSLSPLLFVICMIPLTEILRKVKMGYTLDGIKINHLFFMDDLKLFGKNDNEIDSLASTVNLISQDIGMQFGIKKCGLVHLKRGKLSKTAGIELVNGEKIKEVNDEGYKYLGILELDRLKEEEMKTTFQKEYFRRVRLIMQSKLNGRNKIKAINTWAVSLVRYGAGIIMWKKAELESMHRRTRKLMTMNKELHPRGDAARLYVGRKNGGRGLISCETCVKTEINNLAWYIKHVRGPIVSIVRDLGTVNTEEAIAPREYKSKAKRQLENQWKEKPMHGEFTRKTDGIHWEKSLSWLRSGDLKGCTEALVCSAQEQSLRTNYTKFHIDKTSDTPLCRM